VEPKHKIFLICLMMEIANTLQGEEKRLSARWNVMESTQDRLTKAADLYGADRMCQEDWALASELFERKNN
jgi:hypothetical protein